MCARCGDSGEDPERYQLRRAAGQYGTVVGAGTLAAMLACRMREPLDLYVVPGPCLACRRSRVSELIGDGLRSMPVRAQG